MEQRPRGWRNDRVHLAPGTVRNYPSSAIGKLHVESRHAAVHRAWEEGWI